MKELFQLYDTNKDQPIGDPIMKYSAVVFLKQEFYEDRPDIIIKCVSSFQSDTTDIVSKEDRES